MWRAASSPIRPPESRGHSCSPYDKFLPDRTIPTVPFLLSRYLPHQATSARCYTVGQAIRRAIESWDKDMRVAVMASGGLSHQVLDEEPRPQGD